MMHLYICSKARSWIMVALLTGISSIVDANSLQTYTGNSLPSFKLIDTAGETHALEDYAGRVLLINFWATWCAPCVRELPSLEMLEKQLSQEYFALLAINLGEDVDVLKAFIKQHSVAITILTDTDGTTARDWGLFAYPTSFLLDISGDVRHVAYGELEWDSPEIITVIESLFLEPHSESILEPTPKSIGVVD